MSLSALNYPPLVALSGLGLGASLPAIEKLALESPWQAVRLATLLSYGVNLISVGRPGRLDGQASGDGELSPNAGKTLVAPAGWAFAIWGPIFLGEMVGVVAPFFINESDPIVALLRKTAGPFVAAQLFQSLWCAAFRPKYTGASRFISTGLLGATAYSLSRAHAVFASSSDLYSNLQYGIYFLPMALHFGWTTAASLVNLNGSVAMQEEVSSSVVKYVGHASVVVATALGVFVAVSRDAPVFAGVIAWALSAVADGMKKRLDAAKERDTAASTPLLKKKKSAEKEIVGLDGAATQYMLSRVGAAINGLTAAFVAVTMSGISGKKFPAP